MFTCYLQNEIVYRENEVPWQRIDIRQSQDEIQIEETLKKNSGTWGE